MREVVYKVPDFTDADGITYSDIEVVVTTEGDDVREAAQLAGSVERSSKTLSPSTARSKKFSFPPLKPAEDKFS